LKVAFASTFKAPLADAQPKLLKELARINILIVYP